MLCGVLPFNATTPMAMAVQQVNDPPPPLCAKSPRITPAVEAVVLHMLRKQPDARPQTAAAAAAELMAAVQSGTGPAFAVSTQIDLDPPVPSIDRISPSGAAPVISQADLFSTPGPQTPVSSAALQPVPGDGRTILLVALGAILLIGLAGAGAFGVYLYFQSQGSNGPQGQRSDPANERKKGNANEKGQVPSGNPTPNPTPSPSVSIEEELDLLKERRLDATPGQLPDIDEALQALEQKYPLDYRYTYERAKIANVGSHTHKKLIESCFSPGKKPSTEVKPPICCATSRRTATVSFLHSRMGTANGRH